MREIILKKLGEALVKNLIEEIDSLPIEIKEVDKGDTIETSIAINLISKDFLNNLGKQNGLVLTINGEEV